ncbi:hypothetical protein KIN20_005580 [Parelaphostrongylus tenuis]|uniref:Uncharacterized protein n=1 Tax=Parelaphostrongylus tenuis TaxID=148309 RepID=A0AAD5MT06_PARTN|nr:hypothetical protein KIN20_005580 [Parelaphostrongylus tenuis]
MVVTRKTKSPNSSFKTVFAKGHAPHHLGPDGTGLVAFAAGRRGDERQALL